MTDQESSMCDESPRTSQSFSEVPISSFTDEEISAVQETKRLLIEKYKLQPNKLSKQELFIVTINSKLRPETAAKKYAKWLEALEIFGILSFDEIWKDLLSGDQADSEWAKLSANFGAFAGAGTDKQGRRVFWIRSRPVQAEEEAIQVRCSCIYYTALHADLHTLRNGITFVIDTSNNSMDKPVGNESKMQKVYQSIPLRPQRIFILGAGFVKRLVINTLLSIASLFTSEKVVDRIRFAEMEEVKEEVDDENLPVYVGGGGGGLQSHEDLVKWVRSRINSIYRIPDI